MSPPTKVVVVRDRDGDLERLLAARPERLQVRGFEDPFEDFEDILDFAPDLLFHERGGDDPEEVGALRILQRALPHARFVLVGAAADEVDLTALAARLDARVLLRPLDRRKVAAALSATGAAHDQPDPEVFLDLARGISDEINNPLLFTAGHLQLLESMLDPTEDAEALEQVRSAQRGLERITATMDRIRTIGRARQARGKLDAVRIGRVVREAATEDGGRAVPVFAPDEIDAVEVRGDERLLGAAMRAFVGVAAELQGAADEVSILATLVESGVRLRIEARGLRLGDWQLPRAFEPYSLNRVLRGTTHGLSLFLVQTVVHAHGGAATARRRPDGTVLLDLLLPSATVAPPTPPPDVDDVDDPDGVDD